MSLKGYYLQSHNHQPIRPVFPTGQEGWWLFDEVFILPQEGEKLGDWVVDTRAYHGNSRTCDKDKLWNNWAINVISM